MKNVYVVIGMARSGTSAIARGLKALGVDLGDHLIPPDQAWNAKGFFEDTDIVYNVNRGVLAALNHAWTNTRDAYQRNKNNPAVNEIKKTAAHLLRQRIANVNHWGFKDPRHPCCCHFERNFFFIAFNRSRDCLTNPLASAYSYRKVTGVDIEEGLLLWLMHLIPLSMKQKAITCHVSYEPCCKIHTSNCCACICLKIPLPLNLKKWRV